MNRNLLILGAGQYGLIAKEIAEAMGCFEKIDFLDDNSNFVIGKLCEYEQFFGQYTNAIVAIEESELRLKLIQKLEESCFRVVILVSPKAYISPSSQIMKGTIIEPMAVINANTTVAIGCFIFAGAVINSNCYIGDVCIIKSNSVIQAGSVLSIGTKVNCGDIVFNQSLDYNKTTN